MPKQQPDVITQSRALCREFRHSEAEQLLKDNLSDCEVATELGLLYCVTQREVEAVELLAQAKGAERYQELVQILLNNFECRRQMAAKLGINDTKGAGLLAQVKKETGLEPQDVGIKLSACLIVKNEEAHLDRCLASIKDLVDEIVVVDTGSTDKTVEIAKKYGAVIGNFEWCDDFAKARNESLSLATGNWALWIDADEELTPESFNAIREGLMRPHFGGYFVKIVNYMDEAGQANQYVHTPVRLFQLRPDVRFTGRIHEQISPAIAATGLITATIESALILHHGYRPSEMEAKDKIKRTLDLLNRQVEEEPNEAFHWFNLANTYAVAQRYAEAADAAVECIERLDPKNAYGSLTYQLLQTALIELGKPEEAVERSAEAERKGFATILNEFERAHALSRLGRLDEALESIDKCFELAWPEDLTGDYGIVTHKRHLLKGQILAQMGRLPESLEMLEYVFTVDPHNAAATYTKAAVLEKLGEFDEALRLFECVLDSQTQGRAAHKGASRIHLATGRPVQAMVYAERAWRAKQDDLDAWELWIMSCHAAGHPQAAANAYEEYSRHFELSSEVLINWGRTLMEAGDYEGALTCLADAVKVSPQDPNAYFNCGDLLYRIGQYQEAANLYQAGLGHAPDHAAGWFVLGNCFAKLGSTEGAVLGYEQALRLDPEYAEAKANLQLVQTAAA